MKKLSILIIGLLLVTGFAFADGEFPATPVADLDLSASVTWGVDLNTNYTGFQNDASLDLELYWLNDDDGTDFSRDAMDGLNGYIYVDDVYFEYDGGILSFGYDYIEAKVVIDPIEIVIFSAPDPDLQQAEGFDVNDDTADVGTTFANINGTSINGITVSVPVDPITVDIWTVSDGDWTENADNEYAAGADVEVGVDPLTITVGASYGWFNTTPQFGVSGLVELALADVVEGLDAYVGFDGNMPDGGDFAFDAKTGLTLGLSEDNDDGDSGDLFLDIYFAPYAAPATDIDLDVQFGLTEPEAGGLMDMLYADVTILLADLLGPADLSWYFDASGGYDTGDVDPYFGFGFGSDEIINLNVGIALKAGLTGIDNTTITLDYEALDLTDVDPLEANNIGIFTVKTEVSF